jgi:hypothetical protein
VVTPRRPAVDPALLARARRGELTRSNTRPGTPERRAVDRSVYLRRRAARPSATAREALGHLPPGSIAPTASFFAERVEGGPLTLLIGVAIRRADLRRVSRYGALLEALRRRRISARAFERRVSSWAPVEVTAPPELAGRWRLVADPEAVAALAAEAQDRGVRAWVDSGRSRPLPRRRSARSRRVAA